MNRVTGCHSLRGYAQAAAAAAMAATAPILAPTSHADTCQPSRHDASYCMMLGALKPRSAPIDDAGRRTPRPSTVIVTVPAAPGPPLPYNPDDPPPPCIPTFDHDGCIVDPVVTR